MKASAYRVNPNRTQLFFFLIIIYVYATILLGWGRGGRSTPTHCHTPHSALDHRASTIIPAVWQCLTSPPAVEPGAVHLHGGQCCKNACLAP